MKKSYLWTRVGCRLQLIKTQKNNPYHWVFLPGGPGLGSESLLGLAKQLRLPGAVWLLDLPGDGSNTTKDNRKSFSRWSSALIEAVSLLPNVILVAHSTGGMYALATPQLEKLLSGLVLMDSAPNASWQKSFAMYAKKNPLAEVAHLPANATLKQLTLASASYSFTPAGLKKGLKLLKTLPFNAETHDWSAKYFDGRYKAKWIPKHLPTLILAGEHDHITPLTLFKSKKFQRKNILMREVKNGGHYPWIENPAEMQKIFSKYIQWL